MKRKFFSVFFALVLVCSLGLVTAVPVGAAPVTQTVTGDGAWGFTLAEMDQQFSIGTIDASAGDTTLSGSVTLGNFDAGAGDDVWYEAGLVSNETYLGYSRLHNKGVYMIALWTGTGYIAHMQNVVGQQPQNTGNYLGDEVAYPDLGWGDASMGYFQVPSAAFDYEIKYHNVTASGGNFDLRISVDGGTTWSGWKLYQYAEDDIEVFNSWTHTQAEEYGYAGDDDLTNARVVSQIFVCSGTTATFTADYDNIEVNDTPYELAPRVLNTNTNKGYAGIQVAIDDASPSDTISVAAGTYTPFTVDGKTGLTIQSSSEVTVQGIQSVTTAYGDRDCVVFVKDSTNIVLDDLNIQGQDLGTENTKNYGVIYEASSGEINDCTVSPNTIGDMSSIAIGIWDSSEVIVDPCTIENFGRVGILVYNACTVEVLDSTIEGQAYSGEDEVCYGIEVEGAYNDDTPATASQVTIRGNEIYNCDNTFATGPTWQSGGVYINGWLEYYPEADSTVIVENNDIHDNYSGIIVIKSSLSYAHYNNIYDNRDCGVDNLPAYDASTAVFDATNNWWGHSSGPIHVGTNPLATGDEVSDNVDYEPWLLTEGGDPYDKTLSLPVGWSIVSPDAELESWDAVDEALMCTYDNGGFTTSFVLDPVTPIFIKTVASGGIGFNYAEVSQGIFTTDLEAGWNLIGIPETNATTRAILSPLRYGVNSEVALATLASQGNYNPSGESFYRSALHDADWLLFLGLDLYPFDGYWAYMNVAKEFGVVVVP